VTLLVEAPPGYEPERRYILDVVLRDWLGLGYELRLADRRDVRIALAEDPDGAAVTLPDVLFATPPDDWLTESALPSLGALEDDILGTAFFMLTRYEEIAVAARDQYDRFPAASSAASRAGLLGRPIVDEAVERLWEQLRRAWPRLERRERAFAVVLSHDVDDPLATLQHTPRDVVRQFGGDLVRRRDLRLAARRVRSLLGDPALDPHNTFEFLMDVSERHGLRSAFYFLAYRDQRPRAGAYLFEDPWVRKLIGRVARRGHEIGIHPSFPTYRDPERTREELGRLQRVAEAEGVAQDEWGGRQHYLRWANPDTWRNWEAAGLAYDTTLAFSEQIGFRTGTCHPYRAFDLRARRPLSLREEPFQVMDVTLLSSMGLSLDAAREATLAIAAQCRRHGGRLGILWHNNTLLRSAREQQWYAELIAAVAS
jgi:peptidoglycan/xylan/chitin deacetylase (PgdA/CDA1 family)